MSPVAGPAQRGEGRVQAAMLRQANRALAALAVAAGAFWFCWTLLLWSRWHPQMPWRDLYVVLDELMPALDSPGDWQLWRFLLEPHYAAHRIAVPRLLVALDVSTFGGRNYLLYACGWLSLALLVALPARLAWGPLRDARSSWWLYLGALLTLFFAPAHLWNILNPVNTSWHISLALALLAFWALLRKDGAVSLRDWLLAYALASLSAFSNFAGVIAWLLLPLAGVAAGWRAVLTAAAVSLLFAALYSWGLSSDAAIAAAWESGDPAVAARLREAAQAAMAANGPGRMLARTVSLLCWPLSSHSTAAPYLLCGAAVMVLAGGWFGWLAAQAGRRGAPPAWIRLSLLGATLALGVALAVQLGRVIEQPNYAHGPSYERYNTLVALFWAGVCGPLVDLLRRAAAAVRVAASALLLLVLYFLLYPGGDYLRQEIVGLQVAGRLYAAGETPALRPPLGGKSLRFRPEYVYHFDAFLRSRGLAYAGPAGLPPAAYAAPACAPGLVTLAATPGRRPGLQGIRATVGGGRGIFTRAVLLSREGALVARLYPQYRGSYAALDLLRSADNSWRGDLDAGGASGPGLLLTLDLLGGLRVTCMLAPGAVHADAAPAVQAGGNPGGV